MIGRCEGCSEARPVKSYDLLLRGPDGPEQARALYCRCCADFARIDWSGTIAAIDLDDPEPGDRVERGGRRLGMVEGYLAWGPIDGAVVIRWDDGGVAAIPSTEMEQHPVEDHVWLAM